MAAVKRASLDHARYSSQKRCWLSILIKCIMSIPTARVYVNIPVISNVSALPDFHLLSRNRGRSNSETTVSFLYKQIVERKMSPVRYIAYFRVSTAAQGRSGLGLEGQQAAVASYLATQHHDLVGSFTEIESGRNSDRPQLTAALAQARRQKATVVIAKLDRLARSVAFISAIMESGVEFIAADMPAANRLTIQIMAVIAENEARMISERTKAALAAAKARGVVLGNRASAIAAQPMAREVIAKQADNHADNVLPTLRQIVKSGAQSVHVVAEQLNLRGVRTARGGQWHGTTILNLIRRRGFESLKALATSV